MIVTKEHMSGPNNPWCHVCGRNLNKSHARDCVYLKDTPVYHIYRATERGTVAERLTIHLPPMQAVGGWKADYTDSSGRRNTIDMEFVEEIVDHPAVVNTGAEWYGRHPFVVLPDGEVFGPTDQDFEQVQQELMADKLGEAYDSRRQEMTIHLRRRIGRSTIPAGWNFEATSYGVDGFKSWVPHILFPDEISWSTMPVENLPDRDHDLCFQRAEQLNWLKEEKYIFRVRARFEPLGDTGYMLVEEVLGPAGAGD